MKKVSKRSEYGAAVVEFAVIAVLFLSVVFGIIELGILMFNKHILTNASREGARAGVVMKVPRVLDSEIQEIVKNYALNRMMSFGDLSVPPTVEIEHIGASFPEHFLVVRVQYPFEFLVLSGFGFGPIELKAETRMLME